MANLGDLVNPKGIRRQDDLFAYARDSRKAMAARLAVSDDDAFDHVHSAKHMGVRAIRASVNPAEIQTETLPRGQSRRAVNPRPGGSHYRSILPPDFVDLYVTTGSDQAADTCPYDERSQAFALFRAARTHERQASSGYVGRRQRRDTRRVL